MSAVRHRIDEGRLALMLLTRLPAGRLTAPAPPLGAARWAFPLVGLVVGVIGWAGHAGALALGLGPGIAALTALGAAALATGALHLDGLADFADGIGGGRDRAHALEIMRDSRIGSYGVLALVFAVALAAGALGRFPDGMPLAAFVLAAVASRMAMLIVLDLLPPARSDGLGRMASGAGRRAWTPGMVATAGLVLWIGPGALVALAVAALAAGLVALQALRRIGGQTGDVLGTVQVSSEVGCLIGLAAAMA